MTDDKLIYQLFEAVERITGEPVTEMERNVFSKDVAAFILKWHPDFKEGGADALARLICEKDGWLNSACLHELLPAAVTAAKADGCPDVRSEESLTTRYDVACGLCINETPKKIGEVFKAICQALKEQNLLPDEYFSLWSTTDENEPWPRGRWVSSYGVTGGSEGHYLHVGVVIQPNEEEMSANKRRYIKALREKGCDEIDAERYTSAILAVDADRETIKHVFLGKTLREGREGMTYIYQVATAIAQMLA